MVDVVNSLGLKLLAVGIFKLTLGVFDVHIASNARRIFFIRVKVVVILGTTFLDSFFETCII